MYIRVIYSMVRLFRSGSSSPFVFYMSMFSSFAARFGQAVADCEEALRLDPEFQDAKLCLNESRQSQMK